VRYAAVLDTCVLYPATLRDVLLSLADTGLYRPLWTGDILTELERNLLTRPADRPSDQSGLRDPATRQATVAYLLGEMTRAFEDALVTGYEPLIPAMTNHPKDRVISPSRCATVA
jgi:hypothetical protein